MVPADFGFQDEFAFFDAALDDLAAYEIYKTWMTEVAGQEVDRLIANSPGSDANRSELIAAAMGPFDKAFRSYARRDHVGSADYTFSKYYRWWARQHAMLWLRSR
ncbi:MAG: hypothetical protein JWR80_6139 [Bradyrhizobium sp.]|nr:hypothetical protein [Bradyrhizobium sp.]